MFRTAWGLRVRSAGENPHAAETLGIDVVKIRYQSVLVGGLIAGLAVAAEADAGAGIEGVGMDVQPERGRGRNRRGRAYPRDDLGGLQSGSSQFGCEMSSCLCADFPSRNRPKSRSLLWEWSSFPTR